MTRKTTIRKRMERNMENTKTFNEEKVIKLSIKEVQRQKIQIEVYEKLDEESHKWLQWNIEPKKVASIIAVQEKMVETRAWKTNIVLPVEIDKYRVCRQDKKTVMHWLS